MIFIFLFLSFFCVSCSFNYTNEFKKCSLAFDCGNLTNISYPFWGSHRPQFCGFEPYSLSCSQKGYPLIQIQRQKFRVHQISNSSFPTMIISHAQDICLDANTILNYIYLRYTYLDKNISLFYNCTNHIGVTSPYSFSCQLKDNTSFGYYHSFVKGNNQSFDHQNCKEIKVPVLKDIFDEYLAKNKTRNLNEVIEQGFAVQYLAYDKYCLECKKSGGRCGSNISTPLPGEFLCFCSTIQSSPILCTTSENETDPKVRLFVGFGSAFVSVALMGMIFYLYVVRKRKLNAASNLSRNISSDSSVSEGSHLDGVHLFSYSELEEATNKFDSSMELGEGGFGTVYHGNLRDGRVVAVKRLYEKNFKRVEQFMNEVRILTSMRHRHLVSLYGCTSRNSRELLLVYEFVPNGTVSDHLHGECAKLGVLPWDVRLNIAKETATALVYLHKEGIIHRDVKTSNILLDNDFSIKVGDFGLSRLFPTDATHVSTAPQGTPGYVDPEYHQYYQLTVLSDVFSFGVVLIELISSKPAIDLTRLRHEISLSRMAINKIQNHALHELVDPNLGFDTDTKVKETITRVAELAFQCVQGEKEMRPSMDNVLESLKHIQSEGYDTKKEEDVDSISDDVVLLKSGDLQLSPVSVTMNWNSSTTTPNTST